MNPPPPSPHDSGRTTESVNEVATAASTAFPPRRRISAPASEAITWSAATAPCGNRASQAVASLAQPAAARSTTSAAWNSSHRSPCMERGYHIHRLERKLGRAGADIRVGAIKTGF
jgi:hypothetical protein